MLRSHLSLIPRLRMSGAIPLLPIYASWHREGHFLLKSDKNSRFIGFYALLYLTRTFLNDLGGNPNKKNGCNETSLHAACQLSQQKSFSAQERRAACVALILQWRGVPLNSGGRERIDLQAQDQVGPDCFEGQQLVVILCVLLSWLCSFYCTFLFTMFGILQTIRHTKSFEGCLTVHLHREIMWNANLMQQGNLLMYP